MELLIGLVGDTGSGKSSSFKTLDSKTTFIITPNLKSLPFAGSKRMYKWLSKENPDGNRIFCDKLVDIYDPKTNKLIEKGLPSILLYLKNKRPDIKTIIIDDITHFFHRRIQGAEFRALKNGGAAFAKWGDFAADVYNSLFDSQSFRSDVTVVHCYHSQDVDTPNGIKQKIMTQGKLLDEKIKPASYFTYLLFTKVMDSIEEPDRKDQYKFTTNIDDYRMAKTPDGCFADLYIPNDLNAVITRIKEYEND